MISSKSNALKVLYLSKVYPYPPAVTGDAAYSRGIIDSLAPLARLTVLCGSNGAGACSDILATVDWRIVEQPRSRQYGSLFSRWPSIVWRGDTPGYARELKRLLEQTWDAIVLDNIGAAHALPATEAYKARHPSTTLIYVSHEAEFETRREKYRRYRVNPLIRLATIFDLLKVKATERRLVRKADIVTVINEADLPPLRRLVPEPKYLPLPPGYDGPVVVRRKITTCTPRRVLLIGGRRSEQKRQILLDWLKIGYRPLAEAGIQTIVIGDMDGDLHLSLSTDYPGIKILGFVDDLSAHISAARIGVIADTVGGGFKLRLLSHVFERLPIVGLTGAVSGLPTRQGCGYLGANDLPSLAALVCEIIDDTDRLNALHETAFADCKAAYSWHARALALEGAIRGHSAKVGQ